MLKLFFDRGDSLNKNIYCNDNYKVKIIEDIDGRPIYNFGIRSFMASSLLLLPYSSQSLNLPSPVLEYLFINDVNLTIKNTGTTLTYGSSATLFNYSYYNSVKRFRGLAFFGIPTLDLRPLKNDYESSSTHIINYVKQEQINGTWSNYADGTGAFFDEDTQINIDEGASKYQGYVFSKRGGAHYPYFGATSLKASDIGITGSGHAWSITCWVKSLHDTYAAGADASLFSIGDATSTDNNRLSIFQVGNTFKINQGGGAPIDNVSNANYDFLCWTYNGTTLTSYKNNIVQNTSTVLYSILDGSNSSSKLFYGISAWGSFGSCALSNFMIFNYALTSTQRINIYTLVNGNVGNNIAEINTNQTTAQLGFSAGSDTRNFTVSFWFYSPSTVSISAGYFFSLTNDGVSEGDRCDLYYDGLGFSIEVGGGISYNSPNQVIVQDVWHHIAVTFAETIPASTLIMYYDNVAILNQALGGNYLSLVSTNNATFGSMIDNTNYCEGAFANIKIYKIELSNVQVGYLYNEAFHFQDACLKLQSNSFSYVNSINTNKTSNQPMKIIGMLHPEPDSDNIHYKVKYSDVDQITGIDTFGRSIQNLRENIINLQLYDAANNYVQIDQNEFVNENYVTEITATKNV